MLSPKERIAMAEFKASIDQEWAAGRRLTVLLQEFVWRQWVMLSLCECAMSLPKDCFERAFILHHLTGRQKKLDGTDKHMAHLRNVINGKRNMDVITEDMILRAKEYPMKELVETNGKGRPAKCPWTDHQHDTRRPAVSIKHNKLYCFKCNRHGDSIDVTMLIEGLSFREAVRRLQ